jgi:hypothetical protein
MEITIKLTKKVLIDDVNELSKALKNGNDLELTIFDSTENAQDPQLDVCLQHINHEIPATLWISLSKKEAVCFAKSILTLAKSI